MSGQGARRVRAAASKACKRTQHASCGAGLQLLQAMPWTRRAASCRLAPASSRQPLMCSPQRHHTALQLCCCMPGALPSPPLLPPGTLAGRVQGCASPARDCKGAVRPPMTAAPTHPGTAAPLPLQLLQLLLGAAWSTWLLRRQRGFPTGAAQRARTPASAARQRWRWGCEPSCSRPRCQHSVAAVLQLWQQRCGAQRNRAGAVEAVRSALSDDQHSMRMRR